MGTRKKGLEFAKHIKEIITKATGFERHLEKVAITGGGDGVCTAEFTVSKELLNKGGTLHGGYTATLVDMVTTYALMSKPCHPGVSSSINVSYLAAAREGDVIEIAAKLQHGGRKMAYIDCVLKHKASGKMIAKGGQTKYVDFV
ncbi:CG16986 [Drosophila busckii]|uniref:CG16986 n=1 Tax=Drosophila busckii TaxID=30019 RepID=A0A0M5J7Z6_DROBS|nr:acyl-coenzyme A thioesterase 13 [Drosophila busckii]ALC43348.1 CG16986 [Drosophila busckii]